MPTLKHNHNKRTWKQLYTKKVLEISRIKSEKDYSEILRSVNPAAFTAILMIIATDRAHTTPAGMILPEL